MKQKHQFGKDGMRTRKFIASKFRSTQKNSSAHQTKPISIFRPCTRIILNEQKMKKGMFPAYFMSMFLVSTFLRSLFPVPNRFMVNVPCSRYLFGRGSLFPTVFRSLGSGQNLPAHHPGGLGGGFVSVKFCSVAQVFVLWH